MAFRKLHKLINIRLPKLPFKKKPLKKGAYPFRKIVDSKRAIYLEYNSDNIYESLAASMKDKKLPKQLYNEVERELWDLMETFFEYRARNSIRTFIKLLFAFFLFLSCFLAVWKMHFKNALPLIVIAICVLGYLISDGRLFVFVRDEKLLSQYDFEKFTLQNMKNNDSPCFACSLIEHEQKHYLEMRRVRKKKQRKAPIQTLSVIPEAPIEEEEDEMMNEADASELTR